MHCVRKDQSVTSNDKGSVKVAECKIYVQDSSALMIKKVDGVVDGGGGGEESKWVKKWKNGKVEK